MSLKLNLSNLVELWQKNVAKMSLYIDLFLYENFNVFVFNSTLITSQMLLSFGMYVLYGTTIYIGKYRKDIS